jgi:hypothetical protein
MKPEKLISILVRDFDSYARLDGHDVEWEQGRTNDAHTALGKCSKCGAQMYIETFPSGHFTDGNLDMGRCE